MSVPGKVLNRIILERMKCEVGKTLREGQAGFRQVRSCTDQIATLRIIVEQSIEYFRIFIYIYLHVSLYIVCVAYPLNVRSTMEIRGSHLCDFFLVFPFL